eukprot:gene39667-53630_t
MGVGHRGARVADDRFRELRAVSAFLPPSTNEQYRGSRFAAWFLALSGLGWIIPGMIHSFLPDGGAGVIAGLDLSHNRNMIVGMFAWAGATQIAHGIVTLIIALRYRALVPLFLLVGLVERAAEIVDKDEADKLAAKMAKGQFDMNDLRMQFRQMTKMGGLGAL